MRRRLTLAEAQAGVLPETFTPAEWHAMHLAAGEQRRAMIRRVAGTGGEWWRMVGYRSGVQAIAHDHDFCAPVASCLTAEAHASPSGPDRTTGGAVVGGHHE